MFPSNKPPWGLIRGGLVWKNDFLGGGLFEGGLIRGFTVMREKYKILGSIKSLLMFRSLTILLSEVANCNRVVVRFLHRRRMASSFV